MKKVEAKVITGTAAILIKANYQPLIKVSKNPITIIEIVFIKVATFSPIAPCTAKDSLATLEAKVLGFT